MFVHSREQATSYNFPEAWRHRVTSLYDALGHDHSNPNAASKVELQDNSIGPATGLLAAYHYDPKAYLAGGGL